MDSQKELTLGPEIWMLVCDELSYMSSPSLVDLSYTCKALNHLANRSLYRNIELRPNINERKYDSLMTHTLNNMRLFTKHLTIDEILKDIEKAADLIGDCRALKSVRWLGCDRHIFSMTNVALPHSISHALDQADREVGLHVKLNCLGEEERYLFEMAKSIDPSRLLSFTCKIASTETQYYDTEVMRATAELLVASDRLETITLTFRDYHKRARQEDQVSTWVFPNDRGRMPPVKSLVLDSYDWPATEIGHCHFEHVWDFSNLIDLTIRIMDFAKVSHSIPETAFRKVARLEIVDESDEWLPERSARIKHDFWKHLPRLNHLCVRSHRRKILPQEYLQQIGSQLKYLDISAYDYRDRRDVHLEQEVMNLEEVQGLESACPYLERLAIYIDLDRSHKDHLLYLDTLCRFPKLRRLRILASGAMTGTKIGNEKSTSHLTAIHRIFNYLIAHKAGSSFCEIRLDVYNAPFETESGWISDTDLVYVCDGLRWGSAFIPYRSFDGALDAWMIFELDSDDLNESAHREDEVYWYSLELGRAMPEIKESGFD